MWENAIIRYVGEREFIPLYFTQLLKGERKDQFVN